MAAGEGTVRYVRPVTCIRQDGLKSVMFSELTGTFLDYAFLRVVDVKGGEKFPG